MGRVWDKSSYYDGSFGKPCNNCKNKNLSDIECYNGLSCNDCPEFIMKTEYPKMDYIIISYNPLPPESKEKEEKMSQTEKQSVLVKCPHCEEEFDVDLEVTIYNKDCDIDVEVRK